MAAELKLALRMLARDWRAGELRILALALVVAVASVTSVGFFADRVRQALVRDAHQLLGADLVVAADNPVPAAFADEAARRGLAVARTVNFISMTRQGDNATLTGIRAVSERFPLRGTLRVAAGTNQQDHPTSTVPLPGTAWIDERLSQALSLQVGDVVAVGEARLTVGAILTLEPDRTASFFNFAPRLMMREEDLADSGLVTTGSRVRHSLLAAGEPAAVAGFEAWVKPQLGRGQRLESLTSARPEVSNTLARSQNFVGLTALLAVILAAVAVSLSTRRYSLRHQDGYAVMRCLGLTSARLFRLVMAEFTVLSLVASALGCLIGFAAQYVIAGFVSSLFATQLPVPSALPALQGFLTGLVLLLGFALPPLLQLRNVPAVRVLRKEVGLPQQSTLLAYGLGFAALSGLLVWQAGDAKLGLVVIGGFAGAFVLFGAVAWATLMGLGAVATGGSGGGQGRGAVMWRYGLANLRRHVRGNSVQILALALGLTAVLLLTFTREDLLSTWKASIPPDAPNRFIINIQPDQREPLLQLFREEGITPPVLHPMIRARLMARNGQPINIEEFQDRDRRMAEREFNVSYMTTMQPNNAVISGRWFDPADLQSGALSVEEGIAKRLGWKLGDTLTWSVAGQEFTAPITGIRRLEWDSMQVNFFVIGTPGLLQAAPTSFITSFHLPQERSAAMNKVSQRFSNLTVVDMSAILKQAQSVIDQVVKAVQFVFLFALGAGLLVLYSALLSTQDERQQEAALMRALGASRSQILASQRTEFAVLGLVAGLLAALGASGIGFGISHFVFAFPYQINPWIWLAGPLAGLACVSINAWAGARAALSHPPLLALREA
jgi:putative ABC transport system permease protein